MSIRPIAAHATVTLHVPGYVDFLAADGTAVWATNRGRVERFLPGHLAPVSTVAVPDPCGAMAVAFGAVWVADLQSQSLYRIDTAASRVVAVIPTGLADPQGELSVAAGAGAIWILSDATGVLSRVDPATNKVAAVIRVAPHSYAVAFGHDAVWITNTGAPGSTAPGAVQRIDPVTNRVVATIPVGPAPRFLTVGEGAVWTLNQGDGSVSRIDPTHNVVAATIAAGVEGDGGDIAAGGGAVWVRGRHALLTVIDPAANRVVARFGPPAGSGAVRVAGDLVWLTAHDVETMWALPCAGSEWSRAAQR